MNLVGVGLEVSAAMAPLGVLAALLAPREVRPSVVGAAVSMAGAGGVLAGVGALAGQTFSLGVPGLLPLAGVVFAVDAVSGVFLGVAGAVAVAAGIYGIGYAGHGLDTRGVQAMLPLFAVSMLLVPAAGSVGTLLCWELMAATSLLLVLAEHVQRDAVASAACWYAVMTHLGFVTILAGLVLLAAHAADDGFAALRAAAPAVSPATAGLVFVLCLAGFVHAWLPRAHPEAPSHVSALMSAAMVTMGVYGIIRVGLDLLGGGTLWWCCWFWQWGSPRRCTGFCRPRSAPI